MARDAFLRSCGSRWRLRRRIDFGVTSTISSSSMYAIACSSVIFFGGVRRHVDLERVTPLAVPVLTLIGREKVATNSSDDALLIEAEAMIADAMRPD